MTNEQIARIVAAIDGRFETWESSGGNTIFTGTVSVEAVVKFVVAHVLQLQGEDPQPECHCGDGDPVLCKVHSAQRQMNGTDLIAAERARQARVEGWTPAHDDSHQSQELLDAAECYIEQVIHPQSPPSRFVDSQVRPVWPWEASWWKPSDDPVRNLVKAGALIAAEIDRLLRAAAADGAGRTHDERAE